MSGQGAWRPAASGVQPQKGCNIGPGLLNTLRQFVGGWGMSRNIIIDTDPGQDDAVAILLALASPELSVLGITAVAGNVPLALTEKNARKICELAGRPDVKVFAGADRPLTRTLVTAEHVHGKTGLDGPDLPEPVMPLQSQHAVDFIIETLMAQPAGSVTLCPLGPLTNIALAMQREPAITPRIAEIVLMGGGCFEGGNITPNAEFNIYVDPEAAAIVFGSGVKLTMIPLDCTHQALTSAARVAAFRALGTPVGKATAELLDFFERFDEEKYGTDGGPLHDPCVIAFLLRPDLFTGRLINVEIETASPLTLGMTVADWWGVTDRRKNCFMARTVDSDGFFGLLTERLARL
jgi:purine nucleosidase